MASDITRLGVDVKWQDLTLGCTIVGRGTSESFNTGEWRTDTPLFILEKCKQCLLCAPACPDSAIPVENGKRGEDGKNGAAGAGRHERKAG